MYLQEKTIQHDSTYQMMATVIVNVLPVTLNTLSTNGSILSGISTSLDKKSLMSYEGGIKLYNNLKIMTLKNY
tara:strand:+ start:5046 stop:5264 length:219 start_codon:yes stop_codon:yes gene_type:complete